MIQFYLMNQMILKIFIPKLFCGKTKHNFKLKMIKIGLVAYKMFLLTLGVLAARIRKTKNYLVGAFFLEAAFLVEGLEAYQEEEGHWASSPLEDRRPLVTDDSLY